MQKLSQENFYKKKLQLKGVRKNQSIGYVEIHQQWETPTKVGIIDAGK